MMDVNKLILVGRLGADPEESVTASGKRRVHFPLATSRRFKGSVEGDALTQETLWHNVVVWGKSADFCRMYLKKGDPAYVEGSLRQRKYEGKDGVQRVWTEVNVEVIHSLSTGARRGRVSAVDPDHSDSAAEVTTETTTDVAPEASADAVH